MKLQEILYPVLDMDRTDGWNAERPRAEEVWTPCNKGSRALKIILTDFMNGNVFHHTPGRCGYPSFKNTKESLIDIDFCDFFSALTTTYDLEWAL